MATGGDKPVEKCSIEELQERLEVGSEGNR